MILHDFTRLSDLSDRHSSFIPFYVILKPFGFGPFESSDELDASPKASQDEESEASEGGA